MIAETELEPTHIFNQRIRAEVEAATEVATAAHAIERELYEAVDRARGDHALNLVTRGQLLIAKRALARATEATAVADSTVRALQRKEASARASRADVEAAARRRERVSLEALRAQSRVRRAEIWARIFADLDELDVGCPGLPPLSSAGRSYDAAIGALTLLRRLFS